MASGGVLLVNSTLVATPPAWNAEIAVPATDLASIGQRWRRRIALGAFAAATGIVSLATLQASLAEVLPPHRRKLVDGNRLCLAGAPSPSPLPPASARGRDGEPPAC